MRYLIPGLLVEGASDQSFLLPVLRRELDVRGARANFEVGDVRTHRTRTVDEPSRVVHAIEELFEECDLVVLHHDWRERPKIEAARAKTARGAELSGLVPVRETEAWVLAAMHSLKPPGFAAAGTAPQPRAIESDPDPKATLRRLYTRGDPPGAFEAVGEMTDLSVLAVLPAYQTFLTDLTNALKELHYL